MHKGMNINKVEYEYSWVLTKIHEGEYEYSWVWIWLLMSVSEYSCGEYEYSWVCISIFMTAIEYSCGWGWIFMSGNMNIPDGLYEYAWRQLEVEYK